MTMHNPPRGGEFIREVYLAVCDQLQPLAAIYNRTLSQCSGRLSSPHSVIFLPLFHFQNENTRLCR